jgi:allophanate hydrolase subunit 1
MLSTQGNVGGNKLLVVVGDDQTEPERHATLRGAIAIAGHLCGRYPVLAPLGWTPLFGTSSARRWL